MTDQDRPPQGGTAPQGREWQLLEKVVLESFAEQRRARRWSVFFKLLTFAYLIGIFVVMSPQGRGGKTDISRADHTAIIHIDGVIAEGEDASADNIIAGLRNALEHKHTRAVVLAINSPGGSPVQAGYVYDEIRRLRSEYGSIPVFAVISDMGASGAYYIAAAADDIYADKASLVGSIGVISAGFGFVGALDKLGIERRLFTAGSNKAFLDAFSPLHETQQAFWQDVLAVTHRQFIDQVRAGRGERLRDDEAIFSGLIWSGEQALTLGLVDGLGSVDYVAREVVGIEKTVDFTLQPHPFQRLLRQLAASAGQAMVRALAQPAVTAPLR